MKKIATSHILVFSLGALFVGCAAMKGNANKKSKNPGTDVKNVQGVKDAVGLAKVAQDLKCERGLFVVNVVKDYVAGAREGNILQVFGSGVVTSKPTKDFNPYQYLNYLPRDKAKKIDDSNVTSLSNAIAVEFGTEPVDSSAYATEDAMSDRKTMRTMMGTSSVTAESETSPAADAANVPHTVYFAHKNPNDKTFHISGATGTSSIQRTHDQVHAVKGKLEDGVADLKSFSLEINGHFLAVTIPTDIEAEAGLDAGVPGQIGKPVAIKINPRPVPPTPVKSNFITVAMDDRAGKIPSWRAIYRVADKAQDELQVPTEWTGGAMKEGVVGLEMTRSYVYTFNYPDEQGGTLCVEAGAGVRTTGKLDKKAAEAAKK